MTSVQFEVYKLLVRESHKDYVLDLYNKSQVSKLDVQYEFDTLLWLLGKCISVIFSYNMGGQNKYSPALMLQWQSIMNNIMKSRRYVDFII